MPPQKQPPLRKSKLCTLLRTVALAYLDQTQEASPAGIVESAKLRNEVDSLIGLYQGDLIDPVEFLRQAPLVDAMQDPSSAPLTGTEGP